MEDDEIRIDVEKETFPGNTEESETHEDDFNYVHKTYLSQKNFPHGRLVSLCVLLGMAIFSNIHWSNIGGLAQYLPSERVQVFLEGEYWRLWTAFLVHGDGAHFWNNAFYLFFMGYLTYTYYGPYLYPGITLLMGGLIQALSLWTYSEKVQLVGISGVVYFLGGLWSMLYILVERHRSLFVRTFRTVGVCLIIWAPHSFLPKVSYRTHGIGFLLGTVTAVLFYYFNRTKILEKERKELG